MMLLMCMTAVTTNAQKYLGGDISMLPKYEEANAVYRDKTGKVIPDVIQFMKEQGMNAMRVRLFVDPSKAPADDKIEGVWQNLEYVKALGKRIKDAGLYFLLDFHYSDTWTDPGQHAKPSDWSSLTVAQLTEKMYTYTKESLEALKNFGAEPDAIQVGNELNVGQLWNTGYAAPWDNNSKRENFINFEKSAITACREVCPQAKVVFHVAMNYHSDGNSNNNSYIRGWAQVLKDNSVDYDIMGISYYPYYHGSLAELETLLTYMETNFPDKQLQLVETGYPHSWYPEDAKYNYTSVYPDTPEGQRQFTAALVEKLNAHSQVSGLYWWYPEANGN